MMPANMIDRTSVRIGALAGEHAEKLREHFSGPARESLDRLLADAATVEIRALAGEDVTTARLAIEASVANLAREQRAVVVAEGRALALKAVWAVLMMG